MRQNVPHTTLGLDEITGQLNYISKNAKQFPEKNIFSHDLENKTFIDFIGRLIFSSFSLEEQIILVIYLNNLNHFFFFRV